VFLCFSAWYVRATRLERVGATQWHVASLPPDVAPLVTQPAVAFARPVERMPTLGALSLQGLPGLNRIPHHALVQPPPGLATWKPGTTPPSNAIIMPTSAAPPLAGATADIGFPHTPGVSGQTAMGHVLAPRTGRDVIPTGPPRHARAYDDAKFETRGAADGGVMVSNLSAAPFAESGSPGGVGETKDEDEEDRMDGQWGIELSLAANAQPIGGKHPETVEGDGYVSDGMPPASASGRGRGKKKRKRHTASVRAGILGSRPGHTASNSPLVPAVLPSVPKIFLPKGSPSYVH